MPTLLLSRTCTPQAASLATTAANCRWNYQWLGRRWPPQHLHGTEFALYAETDVALRVCRRHGLALLEPSLELLARLPRKYTSREIEFMTLGAAFQIRSPRFIKPADCTNKAFDASVWETGKFIFCDDDLPHDSPVLVSDPVNFEVEYRTVVLERQVVAFSPYIRGGWLARDEHDRWPYDRSEAGQMLAFCRELLNDHTVLLPPAFVLDVGIIEHSGWAALSSSIRYGARACSAVDSIAFCQRCGGLAALNRNSANQTDAG